MHPRYNKIGLHIGKTVQVTYRDTSVFEGKLVGYDADHMNIYLDSPTETREVLVVPDDEEIGGTRIVRVGSNPDYAVGQLVIQRRKLGFTMLRGSFIVTLTPVGGGTSGIVSAVQFPTSFYYFIPIYAP